MTTQSDPKMQTTLRMAKKRRSKMCLRIAFVSAFILTFSCVFIMNCDPFRVKIVEVSGVKRTSAEEIYQRSEIAVGDSLVTLQVGEIKGKILDQQPLVKKADVRRVVPSRVRIQIYERQPFAYVTDSEMKNIYLIDIERIVLEKPKGIADQNLFHVVSDGIQKADVGERLTFPYHESFGRMCDVLEKALHGQYKKIMFNFGGIKLYLEDGAYVLLGDKPDQDMEKKILLIPVIIRELKERKLEYAGLNLNELAVPTYIKPE